MVNCSGPLLLTYYWLAIAQEYAKIKAHEALLVSGGSVDVPVDLGPDI